MTAPALRDPSTLYPSFCIFIIISTLMSAGLAIASGVFYYLSSGDPNWVPPDRIGQGVAVAVLAFSVLSIGGFIGAIIFTLRLSYRMVRNLKLIESAHMSTSPLWATASYFVPLANLVVPVSAITEVWRGTFAEIEETPPEPQGAIARWWGFWLISNIADNLGARFLGSSYFQEPTQPTPEMLNIGLVLMGAAVIAQIIASVSMVSLFGRLSRAQSKMLTVVQQRHAAQATA